MKLLLIASTSVKLENAVLNDMRAIYLLVHLTVHSALLEGSTSTFDVLVSQARSPLAFLNSKG